MATRKANRKAVESVEREATELLAASNDETQPRKGLREVDGALALEVDAAMGVLLGARTILNSAICNYEDISDDRAMCSAVACLEAVERQLVTLLVDAG